MMQLNQYSLKYLDCPHQYQMEDKTYEEERKDLTPFLTVQL